MVYMPKPAQLKANETVWRARAYTVGAQDCTLEELLTLRQEALDDPNMTKAMRNEVLIIYDRLIIQVDQQPTPNV